MISNFIFCYSIYSFLLFNMKSLKPLQTHKKNQKSLTIDISTELRPRLHHSNPKPRPEHQRSSILNTTQKYQPSTTKYQPTKNFLRFKTDVNTIVGLSSNIHRSFGELKNNSLSKMINKRQPSLSKDNYPKLKDRKQNQRMSIDIYIKSP